jgi:hypothetical protein
MSSELKEASSKGFDFENLPERESTERKERVTSRERENLAYHATTMPRNIGTKSVVAVASDGLFVSSAWLVSDRGNDYAGSA